MRRRSAAAASSTTAAPPTITSSTISGNSANWPTRRYGGGIYNTGGTATITSSLIAGNTAAAGGEISNPSNPFVGTVNLDGYNLIGDSSQSTADALLGVAAGATDILATSDGSMPTALASILDTTLADNGGPTQTHALVAGSPAINAGDPAFTTPPDYDQRGTGFPRVQFGFVDIGAYEFDDITIPGGGLVVDTTDDVFDGDYTPGNLALREAVLLANANPGADTITFAGTLSGGTILLDDLLGEMSITNEVIIDATALAGGFTIDAGNGTDNTFSTGDGYRIFNVDDGAAGTVLDVELRGLTLSGGDVGGSGSSEQWRRDL